MNKESKKKSRTRKELILEALEQLQDEKDNGYGEYEVHYVVPYDEYGGEVRGVIDNFTASNSAEAVHYATELLGFPEIDAEELASNRREFVQLDGYGIVKVRKKDNDKIYTSGDMLKMAEFIFDNYHREVSIKGARIKSDDNREEVLIRLISLFNLPKHNKLTDRYRIYEKPTRRHKHSFGR